jgi:hypothetical protein
MTVTPSTRDGLVTNSDLIARDDLDEASIRMRAIMRPCGHDSDSDLTVLADSDSDLARAPG